MSTYIKRNQTGNCIQFSGSSNPVYFNSCLSAQVNKSDSNRIDIINDARSDQAGGVFYEFFALDFTEVFDDNGNQFSDSQSAVDYINSISDVRETTNTLWFDATTGLDFKLDPLKNTILASNGDAFAVNSIIAIECFRGNISVVSSRGSKVYYTNMYQQNITIDGQPVSSDQATALLQLNTLFSRTGLGTPHPPPSVDPDQTGPVNGTSVNSVTVPISGKGLDFSTITGIGGFYTAETISEITEYFLIDGIGGSSTIYVGLSSLSDVALDNAFSTETDPATLMRSIYSFACVIDGDLRVMSSYMKPEYGRFDSMQTAMVGDDALQVGIRQDGKFYISNSNDINGFRSWDPAPDLDYKLVIFSNVPATSISEDVQFNKIDPNAVPTTPYFIESPDGVFSYPLFRTQEEANYVDTRNGGSGTSSTVSFVDEPTNTVWYYPSAGFSSAVSVAPAQSLGYHEISTEDDGNYIPYAENISVEVVEGTAVNLSVDVVGTVTTSSISSLPSGLVFNESNFTIIGTAPSVGSYASVLTLANSFGSRQVTITIDVIADTSFTSTKCISITGQYNHCSVMLNRDTSLPMYNASDSYSVNMWIKSPNAMEGVLMSLYAKGKKTEMYWYFDDGELHLEHRRDGRAGIKFNTSSISGDSWKMLTVVVNAPSSDQSQISSFSAGASNWLTSMYTVYVDGVAVPHGGGWSEDDYEISSQTQVGSNKSNELSLFNLANGFPMSIINTFVDDIAVYSKALSQSEVTSAYGSGSPVDMTTISDASLYWYWQMGDNSSSLYPTIVDSKGHQPIVLENMAASNIVTIR